ncbi:hypothetical protein bsdtw1_00199 [Clostridium fungisolvens]|uniref:Uncharacterized protein n=1 Tax=Clostridium fungisolvens TaxID=1604897 RepID=A0A6V8SA65_9CLOT|nr:hypothetical protein bsdtw1_00199 [Clostridium fungisolvens]
MAVLRQDITLHREVLEKFCEIAGKKEIKVSTGLI